MNKNDLKLVKKLSKINKKADELSFWSFETLYALIDANSEDIEFLNNIYWVLPVGMLRYRVNQHIKEHLTNSK